jgi:O-antigen/teichoic acid export membrane protein
MVLKVLGGVLLVWLAFTLLGALFEFLTWALVIGAVVFVGAAAYTAVKGRSRRRSLGQ